MSLSLSICNINFSAEEMFVQTKYTDFVSQFQASDKAKSFSNGTIPDWYTENYEPRSSSGNYSN